MTANSTVRIHERAAVPDVIIVTGMSGSGRTQALHAFEDMGYFCIDNLPPRLIPDLAHMVGINAGIGRHLAVASDLRSQALFDEMDLGLQKLQDDELSYAVVFLDARDEVLRRRYTENRRRHPLAREGESTANAIARERRLLEHTKEMADLVIDTSRMRPATLISRLRSNFSELSDQQLLEVNVFSFGFKHGLPEEADIMIDVRFLPNPFYDPQMRELSGLDEKVASFVLDHPTTTAFLEAWKRLLDVVMPGYVSEGKAQLSIAVGCTGGQHRSVAIAEATAAYLKAEGYHVSVSHPNLPATTKE